MKSASPVFRFLLLTGCLAVAGCDGLIPPPQADPTHYYVLAGAAPAPSAAGGRLRIGIRDISVAGYLKSRAMVVDQGSNERVMEDFQRWAEPLPDGVARLLKARLLADPAVASAQLQPFAFDAERDYDVSVDLTRCEGATDSGGGGGVRFAAVIEISTPGPNPRLVARRVFVAPEAAWDGRDFGRLAALLSADVDALGREIAAALP